MHVRHAMPHRVCVAKKAGREDSKWAKIHADFGGLRARASQSGLSEHCFILRKAIPQPGVLLAALRQLSLAGTCGLQPWKWPAGPLPLRAGPAQMGKARQEVARSKIPSGATHLALLGERCSAAWPGSMTCDGCGAVPPLRTTMS